MSTRLVLATTLLFSLPVAAQENLPPEVMFLLDNSASMRLSPTSPRPDKLPECNETYEVRERNVNGIAEKRVTETDVPFVQSAHLSALQMVKQVLGGRAMGAGDDPNRVTCFKQALPFPRNVAQDGYLELVNAGQPQETRHL